jgi:hypothetical protein
MIDLILRWPESGPDPNFICATRPRPCPRAGSGRGPWGRPGPMQTSNPRFGWTYFYQTLCFSETLVSIYKCTRCYIPRKQYRHLTYTVLQYYSANAEVGVCSAHCIKGHPIAMYWRSNWFEMIHIIDHVALSWQYENNRALLSLPLWT